eukprot:scaffold175939_cov27-Tisochrysis_lutea.AAC.6
MIVSRRAPPSSSRSSFLSVDVPRAESRRCVGVSYDHLVYLVRLTSHLGAYPSQNTYYELRLSTLSSLHSFLERTSSLSLPWLPRARWMGSRQPNYVAHMCEQLRHYLQALVGAWCRRYHSFDSFLLLLDALTNGLPLQLPERTSDEGLGKGLLPPHHTHHAQIDRVASRRGVGADAPEGCSSSPSRTASSSSHAQPLEQGEGGRGGAARGGSPALRAERQLDPHAPPADAVRLRGLSWRDYISHSACAFSVDEGQASALEDVEGALGAGPYALWRVVNFDLVPQVASGTARLLRSAAYVLLVPSGASASPHAARSRAPSAEEEAEPDGGVPHTLPWRVHFWIGSRCGADQAGAAAALSVQLSCAVEAEIGHRCSQLRECEGSESEAFRGLFDGLAYAEGGEVASCWRRRSAPPAAARLFCVSGGRPGCLGPLTQLSISEKELDERTCYVLDAPASGGGSEIFQWHGYTASLRDKAYAMLLSHAIRSNDRQGLAAVHVLSAHERFEPEPPPADAPADSDAPSAYTRFLRHMASCRPGAPIRSELLCVYRIETHPACLRRERGRLVCPPELRVWRAEARREPLCSTLLASTRALVLDCDANLFVWAGRASSGYARWAALTLATHVSSARDGVAIHRESEGSESTIFRSYFVRWHWAIESNLHASITFARPYPSSSVSEVGAVRAGTRGVVRQRSLRALGHPPTQAHLSMDSEVARMLAEAQGDPAWAPWAGGCDMPLVPKDQVGGRPRAAGPHAVLRTLRRCRVAFAHTGRPRVRDAQRLAR